MSRAKLTQKEIEAVLESLAGGSCPNGCGCIFCRTFDEGVESGKREALLTMQQQLEEFARKVGA